MVHILAVQSRTQDGSTPLLSKSPETFSKALKQQSRNTDSITDEVTVWIKWSTKRRGDMSTSAVQRNIKARCTQKNLNKSMFDHGSSELRDQTVAVREIGMCIFIKLWIANKRWGAALIRWKLHLKLLISQKNEETYLKSNYVSLLPLTGTTAWNMAEYTELHCSGVCNCLRVKNSNGEKSNYCISKEQWRTENRRPAHLQSNVI